MGLPQANRLFVIDRPRIAYNTLLPARSEEREVLGVWGIPVAILPSCQNMKMFSLQLHSIKIVG